MRDLGQEAWDRAHAARASGDLRGAKRWLDRAHRLLPADPLVTLTLAGLLLETGDAASSRTLLLALEPRCPTAEIAMTIAAACLALDDEAALRWLGVCLGRSVVTPGLEALADRIVARFGAPGWCGITADGRVRTGRSRPARVTLDGAAIKGRVLPYDWRRAARLEVAGRTGAFIGSPLSIADLIRTDGYVALEGGVLRGWIVRPADPDHESLVLVRGQLLSYGVRAAAGAAEIEGLPPLSRAKPIELDGALSLGPPLQITDDNGIPLLGSPIDPSAILSPPAATRPITVPIARPVAVVIPVYRGVSETMACLSSVLEASPDGTPVHVVDDAAPEPGLRGALDTLAASGRIHLHRLPLNRGFPAAANAGIAAAPGHDVILLNSDTLVPPGWIGRLQRAAYAAAENASATPFSNDATILSYPDPGGGNPAPDLAGLLALDRLTQDANAQEPVPIPVGVGFCLFLRHDALDQLGPFREDLFAQGYGEETEWCLRAGRAGWRHVAAPDLFVAHLGGRSFGAAGPQLRRRNAAIIRRAYPDFEAEIARFQAADPLFPARRRLDAGRWAEEVRGRRALLLVSHGRGGGVDEVVTMRSVQADNDGLLPVILDPAPGGAAVRSFSNLRFVIPDELEGLAGLLAAARPVGLEVHHLLGHDHRVLGLADRLGIPFDIWVHDAAPFCQQIDLLGPARRYCGEPPAPGCLACVAAQGSKLDPALTPAALRARSAQDLVRARRVVVPSPDAADRLRRHFPGTRPVVVPPEDDGAWPPLTRAHAGGPVRICVAGALGEDKGAALLLDCARDAGARSLPLRFVLAGFTEDDGALLDAGVFVTGPYARDEAVALIRAQEPHLGFLPSIRPETWCFALSRLFEAGLEVAAFDLGAQAERIRRTGRGTLLPLALPPHAINDALLRLAREAPTWHRPQPLREPT